MQPAKRVTAAYFSPTGGTRGYVRMIAKDLPGEYAELDLTRPAIRATLHTFGPEDLVVLGVPVYYGRVPQVGETGNLLANLRGTQTPLVLVASYGNRAVDDALVELYDQCEQQGFVCVGAGAFVAPHSFTARVGAGRPNTADVALAASLAAAVRERLATGERMPELPGNRPYRTFEVAPFFPQVVGDCTSCGACAAACPAEAILPEASYAVDAERCIRCLACVPACPAQARSAEPAVSAVGKRLEEALLAQEQPAVIY